jgi:hypothetical protein
VVLGQTMTLSTVRHRTTSGPHLNRGGRETCIGVEVWFMPYPGARARAGSAPLPPRRGQRLSRLQSQGASEERGTRFSCTNYRKGHVRGTGRRDSKSLWMAPHAAGACTSSHNSFRFRDITQLHSPPSSARIGTASGPQSRAHSLKGSR